MEKQGEITIDLLKAKMVGLLKLTNREGMDKLLAWLDEKGFYESPCSTRYHGTYVGGLSHHSFNVFTVLCMYDKMFKLNTPRESLIPKLMSSHFRKYMGRIFTGEGVTNRYSLWLIDFMVEHALGNHDPAKMQIN